MKVSVIIPTYNGAHKIMNALQGLEQQIHMPDEVVVVVDGSTDGTVDLLRNARFSFPCFKIIEQQNGGRAKVRNRGAAEASGDLLVFLDDDMFIPQQWLLSHVEHHHKIKDSILCGRLESESMNLTGEFIVFEEWQNAKWNKGITDGYEEVIRLSSPYLAACNFSISKELFISLGQFDVRLNDAEDYDLAVRAFQSNYNIYFSSKSFAYHYDSGLKNFRGYIRRLRQYRVAQEKLVYFKPEIYGIEGQNIRFPSKPKGIKSKVFNFFANRWWITSLEKGYLKWLPKSVRCKFYDIIVTANGVFFPDKVPL